ncbi:hypothetical protein FRB95_008376 [Tulasnella sp. JGI-2019a]|nr:hypothetical protein FRB95_008376 [Tulasnella sp. JGI-2019a]
MVAGEITPKLFTPLQVGDITLSHRVVMAPLTRMRANDAHVPQEIAKIYYSQRASSGTLLITEATYVKDEAGGFANVPGIWSDEQIAAWKNIADAVHAKGAFIYLQLWALGRAANPTVMASKGFKVVSPGDIPMEGGAVPTPLTRKEIYQYVEWYAQAAKNAVHKAGFDGVEINNVNGFLLDQFLQTNSNNRTDEFGGSVENRSRLALLITKAVTDAVGQEKTGVRFSPHGRYQGMRMPDDLMEAQFTHVITALRDTYPKLAYLHVTEPRVSGTEDMDQDKERGSSIDFARRIWGDAPGSPFLAAGGYTRETAIEAAEKYGGAIAFGRSFIANPDLPLRLKYDIPLNKPDRSTFYSGGTQGYIDYPLSEELSTRL